MCSMLNSFTQGYFVPSLFSGSKGPQYLYSFMWFALSQLFPWERTWLFNITNLNPPHQRMTYAVSSEDFIFFKWNVSIQLYLLLEKDRTLHFNKLVFISLKDEIELAQWVIALAPQAEDWVLESQPRMT